MNGGFETWNKLLYKRIQDVLFAKATLIREKTKIGLDKASKKINQN